MKIIYRIQSNGRRLFWQGFLNPASLWEADIVKLFTAEEIKRNVEWIRQHSHYNHQPLMVADFDPIGSEPA